MIAPPNIVSRTAWGANPLVTPASTIVTPTRELWLHHTASRTLHGASGMRTLQKNAIVGGYVDFEYSFVLDNPGPTIYESRGPGRNTAATLQHNDISHAICVMGNFEPAGSFIGDIPSDDLLWAIAYLVSYGHQEGWWPNQITGPHEAASGNSTACCGDKLIAKIPEINRRALTVTTPPAPPSFNGVVVDIARTKTGKGYWIAATDGGVFSYGDAKFYGSMGGQPLAKPVVGIAATPSGLGYALVSSDGGVFCFGDARYRGSMAGVALAKPIVGIEMDADGDGYWLIAADGGVFAFNAGYYGKP